MFAYITKVNIYFKNGRHVIWKQILLALICRALHFCSMPTLGAMSDFLRRGKFEAWRNIRDEIIQFCGILVKRNPIFPLFNFEGGFTILYALFQPFLLRHLVSVSNAWMQRFAYRDILLGPNQKFWSIHSEFESEPVLTGPVKRPTWVLLYASFLILVWRKCLVWELSRNLSSNLV